MKTLITWIVMMAFTAQGAFAARLFPSKGRVVNEQGEAVEYATVVLLKDAEQVAGMTTDGEGRFELKPRQATTRSASSISATNP